MTHWDDIVIKKWKLQQAHLKIYDCKIYYMTIETLKKINCLDWLKSRTWIDFLVSYNLINVYQIWNSVFNKMIWIKNVIFNKKTGFNNDIEAVRLKFKKIQTV